jgi:hypothetical protein
MEAFFGPLGPFLMIGAWPLIISAFTRVFDALWG